MMVPTDVARESEVESRYTVAALTGLGITAPAVLLARAQG